MSKKNNSNLIGINLYNQVAAVGNSINTRWDTVKLRQLIVLMYMFLKFHQKTVPLKLVTNNDVSLSNLNYQMSGSSGYRGITGLVIAWSIIHLATPKTLTSRVSFTRDWIFFAQTNS